MLRGKFIALLLLSSKDRKRRRDADNRMKAPLDFCTRVGLIEDDNLLEIGTFMWVPPETVSEWGCRLILWSMDDQ